VELPEKVQAVADFFARVHTLRVKAGEHRPVPFGCAWVGQHLGISKATVWRALRILEAEGVLKKMDPLPGRDKKGIHPYLPGGGA
jgi:DNA-binding GntR family transcriptional regulator